MYIKKTFSAIQCYECGILEIIDGIDGSMSNNNNCYQPETYSPNNESNVDTCSYGSNGLGFKAFSATNGTFHYCSNPSEQ